MLYPTSNLSLQYTEFQHEASITLLMVAAAAAAAAGAYASCSLQ
jgi:hypothetical protein